MAVQFLDLGSLLQFLVGRQITEAVMIVSMKELNIIRLNKSSDVEACVVHFALDASEITRPFAAIVQVQ